MNASVACQIGLAAVDLRSLTESSTSLLRLTEIRPQCIEAKLASLL